MGNYDNQQQPNTAHTILHQGHSTPIDEPKFVAPKFDYSLLRAQIDEIIHQGLNDMWLLINGEEMDTHFNQGIWYDGKAFAMINNGQVNLLGSRFSALNALLSVGITLH